MFPDIADEGQEGHVAKPVIIIDHFGAVRDTGVKIEEFFQLFFDAREVMMEYFFAQEVSFFAFAAGIADHARGASGERQWVMARDLEAP